MWKEAVMTYSEALLQHFSVIQSF